MANDDGFYVLKFCHLAGKNTADELDNMRVISGAEGRIAVKWRDNTYESVMGDREELVVAIYDEQLGDYRLKSVGVCRMLNRAYGGLIDKTREEKNNEVKKDMKKVLNDKFGSAKVKKESRKKEKLDKINAISQSKIEESISVIRENYNGHTANYMTDNEQNLINVENLFPKRNLSARTFEEVYEVGEIFPEKLKKMVGKNESVFYDWLEQQIEGLNLKNDEDVLNFKSDGNVSKFVVTAYLGHKNENGEENKKMILFWHYMWQFMLNIGNEKISSEKKSYLKTVMPSRVLKFFLKKFTSSEREIFDEVCGLRLKCHLCVLALLISKYVLPVNILAADLKLNFEKMKIILKKIGCDILEEGAGQVSIESETKTGRKRKAKNVNKTILSNQTLLAALRLPVNE